jgi:uncharacterized protein (UPF0332 family)
VKAEAASYLEKAHTLLAEADAIFGIHLNEAAGRTAYLAGFHAAQALIFERTGKTSKTHSGFHTEFLRLTKYPGAIRPGYAHGPGDGAATDLTPFPFQLPVEERHINACERSP